jgi:hypothetical protein
MFAQRRNRLTTHFSERIPVFKHFISVHCVGKNAEFLYVTEDSTCTSQLTCFVRYVLGSHRKVVLLLNLCLHRTTLKQAATASAHASVWIRPAVSMHVLKTVWILSNVVGQIVRM